jgi:pyruvate dehydrogenase E2 component (dihydrolipoamide acetyltransferase)
MAEIIEMPKLSDTMEVGTLVTWLKQEGDAVETGDMIAEVETDKATMEVEAFDPGVMLKHYVQEGDQIPIGAPMCAIGEEGEEPPEADTSQVKSEQEADKEAAEQTKGAEEEASSGSTGEQDHTEGGEKKKGSKIQAVGGDEEAPAGKEAKTAPAETPPEDKEPQAAPRYPSDKEQAEKVRNEDLEKGLSEGGRIKASPLAKKIADKHNIPLELLSGKGTGPGGRIVKADVEKAIEEGVKEEKSAARAEKPAATEAPAPEIAPVGAPIQDDEAVKVSNMRGAIARRLVESKTTIPHFYLEIEIDAGPLGKLRKELNEGLAAEGIKLSVNDLALKAVSEALRRVPAANRSWQGDTIQAHGAVHLAFGVAIEDGLVTPVIRDAHAKSIRQLSSEAKELIKKARARKLKPDEMSGSTCTVTNLGMYGVNSFYGIINPPNAAILSFGATIKKPVVDAKNEIVPGERMMVGLSGDHRVIDGATGAEFLQALKDVIEKPALILV